MKIGFITAATVIITNMIGTGVFTSLGLQLIGIDSGPAIILLWLLGGIAALSGAAVYGELSGHFPQSGGEYNFLSRIYHPAAGFLAGWISATAGFAAPIALSAQAFGTYFSRISGVDAEIAAAAGLLAVTLAHMTSVRKGAFLQNLVAVAEVLLILVFILAGLFRGRFSFIVSAPPDQVIRDVFNVPFAVSLVYVFFAYSGWNAAAYIAGEVRQPRRNVPAALIAGTAGVMLLYVLLNVVFLGSAPREELRGVIEVGHISATHIFGPRGAQIMSFVISVALLASVSGMTLAGPRVAAIMAEDYPAARKLFIRNRWGAPYLAVAVQSAIALILVLTGTFERIMTYAGFTLSLSTTLTVFGIFVVRRRHGVPEGIVRCWGYPVTPAVFLLLNLWMMLYTLYQRPLESIGGLLTAALGVPVYLLVRCGHRPPVAESPLAAPDPLHD